MNVVAYRKYNGFLKSVNGMVYDLPCPANLSIWWNYGSLLGFCLGVQIVSGIFLAMHYVPDESLAWESVVHITRDVNSGWFLRSLHANTASGFMLCLYLHIGRGIYYGSYLMKGVWGVGVVILVLVMGEAFMGYVLPWGQMSYWGATVITNMVTVVPLVGSWVSHFLWGGYSVGDPTLKRFFVLHFVLPFVIMGLAGVHMWFLHGTGSNNPLGVKSDFFQVRFHSYYTVKDLVGVCVFLFILSGFVFFYPNYFSDAANFMKANYLKTPEHIQPEWYFLFAYAILRSVPNKVGGVVAMLYSIVGLLVLPMLFASRGQSLAWYPIGANVFYGFLGCMVVLTWVGSKPVEAPYTEVGLWGAFGYLGFFSVLPLVMWWEDKIFGSLSGKVFGGFDIWKIPAKLVVLLKLGFFGGVSSKS